MLRYTLPLLVLFMFSACRGDDVERGADGTLVLGGVEQTETVERGVVPGQRTLVLDGFSGEIRLSGTPSEEARLRFVKTGRGDDLDAAREVLAAITIEEAGDDAAYRYRMRAGDASRASVMVEGTVPQGTRLEIILATGDVVVRDVTAALQIRVDNGRVQVAGAAGNVNVEAQNAEIIVGMARVPETAAVRLTTGNGRIALGLPADAGVRIDAESKVGAIRADGLDFQSQQLDPEGAGARFRASMGHGVADVRLRTQNGSIELVETDRLTVISAVPPAAADSVQIP